MSESHNWEAERVVLGALMRGDTEMAEVLLILAPEHFHRPAHRHLFERMQALVEQGQSPSLENVLAGQDEESLSWLSGRDYLSQVRGTGLGEGLELNVWWVRRHAAARAGIAPNDWARDGQAIPFRRPSRDS